MDSLPPVLPPSPNPTMKWWIIGGILLGVIIILFAFYFFRSTLFPPSPKLTQKQNPAPSPTSQRANPLFETQSATVQGAITKINSSTISITNDRGQSDDFPISDKVLIYKYKEGSLETSATASSDLKTIEIGKKATLFLELINDQYQVVSISYFPPPPVPKR